MFQENELITFIIVLGIGVFLLANRRRMEPTASDRVLLLSFIFYAMVSVTTLVEGFIFPVWMNIVEHVFILLHTLSFTIWIWLLVRPQPERRI